MGTGQAPRRMSSRAVQLGALGALSLTLVACGSNDEVEAYCVDADTYQNDDGYQVVDEDLCDDDGDGHSFRRSGYYFWYYGGTRAGSLIRGGTTVKPKNVTIKSAGGRTIQRGGFGSRSGGGS